MKKQNILFTRKKNNWIRTKLMKAESTGFTNKTQEEILALSKQMLQDKLENLNETNNRNR